MHGEKETRKVITKIWKSFLNGGRKKIKPYTSKVFKLEDTKDALYALMNREIIGKAIIKIKS